MSRLRTDLLEYNSKYEYENGVLKNKFDIRNSEVLDKVERTITTRQLAKLYLDDSNHDLDAKRYLDIHWYLFRDIYDFAGEIRDENIYKSFTFCPPQNAYRELEKTLENANSMIPKLDTKDKLINYVAVLYSDLDFIHPFREGNGRTLREFIREYMKRVCLVNNLEPYYLDYSKTDRQRYVNAVVKADVSLDYTDLITLFNEILNVREKNIIK